MKKNNISDELMVRFYCGDVTGEEIKKVLLAAEQDPDLMEEIKIMTSISDDLDKIRAGLRGERTIFSIQPSYVIPMMRMAAQNKSFATSDCVVRCEH